MIATMLKYRGQATELPDHVKVILTYTLPRPISTPSKMMVEVFNSTGPFVADVWIMLPAKRVYSILAAYQDAFDALKDLGVLDPDAILHSYKLALTDTVVPAFLLEEE